MRILLAPDSFKGSLDAERAAQAMKEGVLLALPHAQVISLPIADGGEGTAGLLAKNTGGHWQSVTAHDPLMSAIQAGYGILGDGCTAVIEVASASGLTLLPDTSRNPMLTTSFGTGELLLDALNRGFRHFIIGLGGSATNDAGAGILQALGIRWLDDAGNELPPGGAALANLHLIDTSKLDSRLPACTFRLACDVNNPLTGPQGASAVFGPQKGATPVQIPVLDQALKHFAYKLEQHTGVKIEELKGGGAAGGIGAGLAAFLPVQFVSGIQLFLDTIPFNQALQEVDLVITGEGKIDEQTLQGKAIWGVAQRARQYDVSVLGVGGSIGVGAEKLTEHGFKALFSLLQANMTVAYAMENAFDLLRERTNEALAWYMLKGE